jgi:AraC-like DNA-binding protein
MSDRFRVSGLLAQRLREQEISLSGVLALAGLPTGFFQQEKIFVWTAELFALWRAIGEVSRDPAIGLKLGTETRIERYDPATIAALCSQSFGDALRRMARYKQLTCPEEIRLTSSNGECAVEFNWLLARDAEPAVLVDLCLSWILAIGRRGLGAPIFPLRLELTRTAKHRVIIENHFGCRVKFRAARNALIFRENDLELPFVTHNAELLAVVGAQLDAELNARRSRQTLGDQVKSSLKRLLAGQRPTIHSVARQLNLSARTLQRRLAEGGVTFQQMLDEARRELAHHYLGQSSVALNETAYLLGYEDPNSFFRAFHDWEGTSPGRWRVTHQPDSARARAGSVS